MLDEPSSLAEVDSAKIAACDADVLIIGAGTAGLSAALDLAEAGRRVLLVDRALSHGGTVTLLDRQFPTDGCGFCQLLPRDPSSAEGCLKSMLSHPGITFLPSTDVEAVEGGAGGFRVRLRRRATCVDPNKCTHCGRCIEACQESYPDALQGSVVSRKAIGYRTELCAPSDIGVDKEHCTLCGACVSACPEDAICLDAQDTWEERRVSAIVVATGFRLHDPSDHPELGYGRFPDVLTSLEFERLIAKGWAEGKQEILRPSDNSLPSRIAWIQCVGSREVAHNYCSSVCCMIALKQARMARALLPEAELEILYMDLRTCGKNYERYLQEAKAMGIRMTRGRPAEVLMRQGRLHIQLEEEGGSWREEPFDLVVLSVGLESSPETLRLAQILGIELDQDGFLSPEPGSLSRTSREGIYMAGAACEPRDIPEAVAQAHEAAALAASHSRPSAPSAGVAQGPCFDPREEEIRTLVALCDCSGTLSPHLDLEMMTQALLQEPEVVSVSRGSRLCLQDGLEKLREDFQGAKANALIMGACTPRWLHGRLRASLAPAGLDPQLIQIVNLREQCAWAHHEEAKASSMAQMKAALERIRAYAPLGQILAPKPPERAVLILGGGPAGISAAMALSELGYAVILVEKEEELGGNMRFLRYGLTPEFQPQKLLKSALERLGQAPGVRVIKGASLRALEGRPGHFRAEVICGDGASEALRFGSLILATGGQMFIPGSHLHGEHPGVLTQRELELALFEARLDARELREVVMIQCVGSRDKEHPYCSRICCAAAIKNALKLLEANPRVRLFVLYRDLRAFGTMERHYRRAREGGALFVPFDLREPPFVSAPEGTLEVDFWDPIVGSRVRLRPDRVVLSCGIVPSVPREILNSVGLGPDSLGFLAEENPKFRPLDLADGIYGCGMALGPAFLGEAMAQGRAAAMRAVAFLEGLQRKVLGGGARVQPSRCSACGLCVEACPVKARELDPELGHAVVYGDLCQACGTCVAICPNDACQLLGVSDKQTLWAIEALMES